MSFRASALFSLILLLVGHGKVLRIKLRQRVVEHDHKSTVLGPMFDKYGQQMMLRNREPIYEGMISVGTPYHAYRVIFDTRSFILTLPRKGCKHQGPKGEYCAQNKRVYDETKSSTSKKVNFPVKMPRLGKTNLGEMYEDRFAFGDANCKKKLFELKAKTEFGAMDVLYNGDQGILGLGLPPKRGTSIFQQAMKEGLGSVFTLHYKRCPADETECRSAGQITFGELDTMNCGPLIGSYPIPRAAKYWEFTIKSMTIGALKLQGPEQGVVDSKASYIYIPPEVLQKIAGEIGAKHQGNGIYVVPCKNDFQLDLEIEGKIYTLPHKEITRPTEADKIMCELLIAERGVNEWNFGIPLARTFCLVHDLGKRELGFAKPLQVS